MVSFSTFNTQTCKCFLWASLSHVIIMYCLFCSDICLTFSKTEFLFLDELLLKLFFFLGQVWSERRVELAANVKPLPEVHQVNVAVMYRCKCSPSTFIFNFTNTYFFPPSIDQQMIFEWLDYMIWLILVIWTYYCIDKSSVE